MKLSELNEIYDKYYLMVMKVAFNYTHDYHYAQDICQEVFVQMYVHRDEIKMETVKALLLTITKNKTLNFMRDLHIEREVFEGRALETEIDAVKSESPYTTYMRHRLLIESLKGLKEKDRQWYEIIVRVVIEGESQQEAADDLGISLSVLRLKQHRARKWLRKHYPYQDF